MKGVIKLILPVLILALVFAWVTYLSGRDGKGYTASFSLDDHGIVVISDDSGNPQPALTGSASVPIPLQEASEGTASYGLRFAACAEPGYEVTAVTCTPAANFHTLLTSEETGEDGVYELTKVIGNVSISVTTGPVKGTDIGARLGSDTLWRYLDDGSDPAQGSADRTAWTRENFDDSSWKAGFGSFGANKGDPSFDKTHVADYLLAGCDGENNVPAYFFRTTFEIPELEGYNKLVGRIIYDDAVILYINGQRVAAGSDTARDETGSKLDAPISENLQYGGANGALNVMELEIYDMQLLHTGTNTIAVELHNSSKRSSDVWLCIPELKLCAVEPDPAVQTSIFLTVGENETCMNLTWYSDQAGEGGVLVAKKADLEEGQMPASAVRVRASVQETGQDGMYSHQASLSHLESGCSYAYQLVNGITASKVMSFSTPEEGGFTFALAGDPQIGSDETKQDADNWSATLKKITGSEEFDGVDFLLSLGDQVTDAGDEEQYDGFIDHSFHRSFPTATVIGNHDDEKSGYAQHFHVPNESAYGVTKSGGDYYFTYQNTLFFVLNTNSENTEEHEAFMHQAIAATEGLDIRWRVVAMHHSLFSVGNHADSDSIDRRRDALVPLFERMDVDAVLMGHDHTYCRTYLMDGLTPVTDPGSYDDAAYTSATDPQGILYLTANSASGSKFYDVDEDEYPYSAVFSQEEVPNISCVTVDDDSFTIITYRTMDMTVVDSFTIRKTR